MVLWRKWREGKDALLFHPGDSLKVPGLPLPPEHHAPPSPAQQLFMNLGVGVCYLIHQLIKPICFAITSAFQIFCAQASSRMVNINGNKGGMPRAQKLVLF